MKTALLAQNGITNHVAKTKIEYQYCSMMYFNIKLILGSLFLHVAQFWRNIVQMKICFESDLFCSVHR